MPMFQKTLDSGLYVTCLCLVSHHINQWVYWAYWTWVRGYSQHMGHPTQLHWEVYTKHRGWLLHSYSGSPFFLNFLSPYILALPWDIRALGNLDRSAHKRLARVAGYSVESLAALLMSFHREGLSTVHRPSCVEFFQIGTADLIMVKVSFSR